MSSTHRPHVASITEARRGLSPDEFHSLDAFLLGWLEQGLKGRGAISPDHWSDGVAAARRFAAPEPPPPANLVVFDAPTLAEAEAVAELVSR